MKFLVAITATVASMLAVSFAAPVDAKVADLHDLERRNPSPVGSPRNPHALNFRGERMYVTYSDPYNLERFGAKIPTALANKNQAYNYMHRVNSDSRMTADQKQKARAYYDAEVEHLRALENLVHGIAKAYHKRKAYNDAVSLEEDAAKAVENAKKKGIMNFGEVAEFKKVLKAARKEADSLKRFAERAEEECEDVKGELTYSQEKVYYARKDLFEAVRF